MAPEPTFDAASDHHVALWDELPLWSSLAGQLLLEHVPLAPRRVLDVGCGSGFPTLELAERLGPTARVTGIDPWWPAVKRARAKRETWPVPNAAFVLGDAARLPFRDGAFEMVVSNLGVNNFEDPEAACAECRRVLATDGVIALTSNLVGHFAELYEVFASIVADDAAACARLHAHIQHRATVERMTRRLERNRFHVTDVHERGVAMRFRDGRGLLAHHFIRLGFLPDWIEVMGEEHPARLAALGEALDRVARRDGSLELSVPLAVVLARATV